MTGCPKLTDKQNWRVIAGDGVFFYSSVRLQTTRQAVMEHYLTENPQGGPERHLALFLHSAGEGGGWLGGLVGSGASCRRTGRA